MAEVDVIKFETLEDTLRRLIKSGLKTAANQFDQDKLSLPRVEGEKVAKLLERFSESAAIPIIDWSSHAKYPRSDCECKCGGNFWSHTKFTRTEQFMGVVTMYPCPNCLSHISVRRVRSQPESFSISKFEVADIPHIDK